MNPKILDVVHSLNVNTVPILSVVTISDEATCVESSENFSGKQSVEL